MTSVESEGRHSAYSRFEPLIKTTPAQQPHDPLFDEIQKLHTGLEHLKSKSNVSDHQSIRRCYRRSQHCFSFAMRCHGSKPSPSRDAESLFLRLRRTPSDTALKHEGLIRHGRSKSLSGPSEFLTLA